MSGDGTGTLQKRILKRKTQQTKSKAKRKQLLSDGNEMDTSEASISFSCGSEGSIHLGDTDNLQLEEMEGEVIRMKIVSIQRASK